MPMPTESASSTAEIAARQSLMAVLADAAAPDIAAGLAAIGALPPWRELRPTQTGLVMVRGRIGGDGAPFHCGEATVTRATVELATGETGFAYVLGRDHEKARLVARCDALWQASAFRDAVERHVLAPIRARHSAARERERARTAATRVEFLTLVRGES
jgi:alpha-D-ribose 1-methylphosphonate 5-triphosphate synthase subunit PhnG